MASQFPIIGTWYHDPSVNQIFEVVAIDEQSASVEVQYIDGEVGEFEMEGWEQLTLSPAEAPEDAGAAFELTREDRLGEDSAALPDSWNNPLAAIEPDSFPSIEDF